jgi:hypothetical protein
VSAKFTKPKAKVPFCWVCDKRLYAGGRAYVEVKMEDGYFHPVHDFCVPKDAERKPAPEGGNR